MDITAESVKSILKKEGLEKYIALFEENKLLDGVLLSKMTEEDYARMGITIVGDRKKLISLFPPQEKSSSKGCLVASLIIIAVIAGILILLHYMGVLDSVIKIFEGLGIALLAFVLFFWLS